ncbi:MAG: hypothetical protein ACXVZ2_05870 [Gaiellaceae bacterium]
MRARWRRHGRAPFFVALLLSVPVFFCALMGFSLWLEEPAVQTFTRNGHSVTIYHQAAAAMEARIWIAAALDGSLLILIGALANLFRRGIYISSVGAIVLALATVHRLDHWTAQHSLRYPLGMDLIRESSTSNTQSKGQWEATARITSLSFAHWTIVIAIAVIVISLVLELRHRRSRPMPALPTESTPQPPGMAL